MMVSHPMEVNWTVRGFRTTRRANISPERDTSCPVRLTYHAGTELRADLVGYVTGDGAIARREPANRHRILNPRAGAVAAPAPGSAASGAVGRQQWFGRGYRVVSPG